MRVRRKSIGGTSETSADVHTATTPGNVSAALVSIDMIRPCMGGAHHPHVQHVGKGDVGGEGAAARYQRPVLETGHRTSDEAHVRPCSAAIVLACHARAEARRRRSVGEC